MIVHHFATVLLMVMSWCNNMVRVGSLVLCLHDTVDYWLEVHLHIFMMLIIGIIIIIIIIIIIMYLGISTY